MVDLDAASESDFYEAIDFTRNHLVLQFHRLIGAKLSIYVNNIEIEKFDPFFKNHAATQQIEESISVPGKGTIGITAYLIPYKDKCSDKEQRLMNGRKDYSIPRAFTFIGIRD